MNKDFNIDEIVKDKLQNFSVDETPQGWEQVSKTVKRHKQRNFVKNMTIIAMILIIATGFVYLINKDNLSEKNIIKNKEILQNNYNKQNITETYNPNINDINNDSGNNKNNSISYTKTKKQITDNNKITDKVPKINSKEIKDTEPSTHTTVINKIIQLPNADFTVDYTKGCQPLTVNYTAVEKSDTMLYYWNFGDGTSSNEQSPSHTYTHPGKFTVSLSVKYYRSGKIINKSYRDLIEVYSLPESKFEFTNRGSTYYFSNTSKNNQTNIWTGFDGKIITEKSPEYEFSKNGKYTISLISISDNGCSDTLTKEIEVNSIEHITLYMPNAFTPDGDGINDYFGVTQPLEYKEFYMQIFDLQGNLLYFSSDKQQLWDGKNQQGKPMPVGKYIWKVLIKTQKGNEIQKSGYLNLLK